MQPAVTLIHEFVGFVPTDLQPGVLYISLEYRTVAHRCCCGCGNEVVTPLSPAGWQLTFDGETVSLDPSIGNWSFACRSHYWIRRNRVNWAPQWSAEEVAVGRASDLRAYRDHFGGRDAEPTDVPIDPQSVRGWSWIVTWFGKANKKRKAFR